MRVSEFIGVESITAILMHLLSIKVREILRVLPAILASIEHHLAWIWLMVRCRRLDATAPVKSNCIGRLRRLSVLVTEGSKSC